MTSHARLVGFNHVAVVIGDLEEALDFYERLLEVELRGRSPRMTFIDAEISLSLSQKVRQVRPTIIATSVSW